MTLRLRDLRAVYELANECRDLGDDATLWREHLFERLSGLVGAGVGMGGEMAGCRAGKLRSLGTADWGWQNGFDRAGWLKSCALLEADPLASASMNAYVARLRDDEGVCLSRTDYLADDDWYRSQDYSVSHTAAGTDMMLVCFRAVPGTADEFSGLLFCRERGAKDFTPRDRELVREAHALVAPLIGGPLARFADPSPSGLPPRARQVLKCLLEGDGDKQVAARLGLSVLTVNQHTKRIYCHFGVASRAELLARWVRRGWGSNAAWAG